MRPHSVDYPLDLFFLRQLPRLGFFPRCDAECYLLNPPPFVGDLDSPAHLPSPNVTSASGAKHPQPHFSWRFDSPQPPVFFYDSPRPI